MCDKGAETDINSKRVEQLEEDVKSIKDAVGTLVMHLGLELGSQSAQTILDKLGVKEE